MKRINLITATVLSVLLYMNIYGFESEPSNEVGFVRYEMQETDMGYNTLSFHFSDSIPLDFQYLTDQIPGFVSLSYWDEELQYWMTYDGIHAHNSQSFEIGRGYLINVSESSFISSLGDVIEDLNYYLQNNAYGGLNFISVPVTETSINNSGDLFADIIGCLGLAMFDTSTQEWIVHNDPLDDGFIIDVADMFFVQVNESVYWPDYMERRGFRRGDRFSREITHIGLPKIIGTHISLADDSLPSAEDFSFTVHLDNESQIYFISGESGSFYSEETGLCFVNIGNFMTDWTAAENVVFRYYLNDILSGTISIPIIYDGSSQYVEDVVTVEPLLVIDSLTPEETEVTVSEGTSQEFSIIASHPGGNPLAYEWLLDGVEISTANSYLFDSAIHPVGEYELILNVIEANSRTRRSQRSRSNERNEGILFTNKWTIYRVTIPSPLNLVVIIEYGFAELSWDVVEEANSYIVFASDYPYAEDNDWEEIAIVAEPSFSEEIANERRFYRVVASTEEITPPARNIEAEQRK